MPDPSMGPDMGPDQFQEGGGPFAVQDWDFALGEPVVDIAAGDNILNALATEYVHVQVTATDAATGATADPTPFPVSFALVTAGEPGDIDWFVGDWLTRTASVAPGLYARALVGPARGCS